MTSARMRLLADRVGAARRRTEGGAVPRDGGRDPDRATEGGFVLLEEIVSISLLIIVMSALATFFLGATQSTSYQRAKQSAIQLSNTEMDSIRALHAGDLLLGRNSGLVTAQFASAVPAAALALASMQKSTDTTNTTTLTLKPSVPATVNNITYTVNDYLGQCYLLTDSSTGTSTCGISSAAVSSGTPYLRAVVATTWPGVHCANSVCYYVTSSLISAVADPVFSLNQTGAAAPVVATVANQISEVGDAVSLQLALAAGTGVTPATWVVSGLPAGLSADANGLITGAPTAVTSAVTVTATVTDAFLRTATATFTWTVYPPLTTAGGASGPGNQTNPKGTAITPLTLTATGGSGTYTWTDPNATLPAGLSISGNKVVGTPTTVGSNSVTLVVTDSAGAKRATSFTWTITYPTLTSNPANQLNTVNAAIRPVTLTATGGSGNYVWTDPNGTLPRGLTLSGAGVVTGTPTAVGTSAVRLRVTDTTANQTTTASFSWSIVGPPTITGLTTPFSTAAGSAIAPQTLPYTCPTSSCTYTLTGAPSGVGMAVTSTGAGAPSQSVSGTTSGNLYLVGTVAAPPSGASAYAADVASQGATDFWRLDETSGTTGTDSAGSLPLTEQSGVGHGATGATLSPNGSTSTYDTASTFNGSSTNGSASTTTAVAGPQVFSESIWFRTTSTTGGKLLGFGDATTGLSNNYDRQLYMDNSGHVSFGTCASNGCPTSVTTTGAYNDGAWHQAVGTLSGAGLSLYVDGGLITTNTSITTAQSFNGYWRLGGDNLGGWNANASSNYYTGTLDDASIYPTALTAAQIATQYADAGSVSYSLVATPTDTVSSTNGVPDPAAWTVSPQPPPTVTGLTAITTTFGATIASQKLRYTCPSNSCSYALTGAPAGIGIDPSRTGPGASSQPVSGSTSGALFLVGTVSAAAAPSATAYAADVATQGASNFWKLNERSGSTGADSIGSTPLTELAGVTQGAPGSTFTNTDSASTFDGSSTDGSASTTTAIAGPSTFSESMWFKTTTTSGGKLFGFSDTTTGTSGHYDRQVYMDNTGHLDFGVCQSGACPTAIATPNAYNDGAWHQAAGTMSGAGLTFYVDGTLIGTNTAITSGEAFNGYWRVGGGSLSGWPGTYSSIYFAGTMDDISVYPTALTAAQVQKQYADSGRTTYTLTATPTDTAGNVTGAPNQVLWTVYPQPTVSGLTSPLRVNAGATIAAQSLPYSCPTATCTYTVAGMPAGIGLSTSSSATTGAATVTVSATSGTLYLVGTVDSAANGSYGVTVTPLDTTSGTTGQVAGVAAWTVYQRPTISALSTPFPVTAGGTVANQTLTATCSAGPCTYALSGAPSGIGLSTSSTGSPTGAVSTSAGTTTLYLRGTVAASANRGSYTLTVSPADSASGLTGTPTTAAWTVYAPPTVTGLTQSFRTTVGATVSYQSLAYTCPAGSCTFALTGAPAGVGLSTATTGAISSTGSVAVTAASGTIYLRGVVSTSATTGPYTLTVTPTDTASGITGTAATAGWTVYPQPTVTGLPANFGNVPTGSAFNVQLSFTCPTANCTYNLMGAPSGVGLSATSSGGSLTNSLTVTGSTSGSIYLRGTATPSGNYTVTITPIDNVAPVNGPVLQSSGTVS